MMDYKRTAALRAVSAERNRQEAMKQQGRFDFTCADPEMTNFEAFAVLGEEIGEVAEQCLLLAGRVGNGTPSTVELRKELTQVAAVAVAWIEALS